MQWPTVAEVSLRNLRLQFDLSTDSRLEFLVHHEKTTIVHFRRQCIQRARCRPSYHTPRHVKHASMTRAFELLRFPVPVIPASQMGAHGRKHRDLPTLLLHRPNSFLSFCFEITVFYGRDIIELLGLS